MEMMTGSLAEVAHLIQLSVAPIFLITGVATTLVVLSNRLARIVDRGRVIENLIEARPAQKHASGKKELLVLERRARLVYRAITLGVLAAILVCLLMTAAFLGAMLHFNAAGLVAILFITALFAYTGALMCFLREVFLAIGAFELGIHPDSQQ